MNEPMPGLTVCRFVHYVSYGTPGGEYHSRCRAAVVTEVGQWVTLRIVEEVPGEQRTVNQQWDPTAVALTVFNPTGVFLNGAGQVACQHDADGKPGTWHWPERSTDPMQ